LTERINEEYLASEAQRYRYRVIIERGTRNEMIPRKRGNETIMDGQNTKRQRIDVIELSSDGEEPPRPPVVIGRRVSPVSIGSSTSDDDSSNEDLDNTLVEEKEDMNDTSPESSTSSTNKGKGKELFVDLNLDLQEELECFICCLSSCLCGLIVATLLLVPHVCSPCGHGACGPCSISLKDCTNSVYKWRQKSDQCPQCRIKLSKEEPFLRDYILERIAEKYAKVTLSPEELVQREVLTTYSSPPVLH
jgi:hypothetical protein